MAGCGGGSRRQASRRLRKPIHEPQGRRRFVTSSSSSKEQSVLRRLSRHNVDMTTGSKSQSAPLVARALEEADKCSGIISTFRFGLPRNVRSDYTGRYLLMSLDHREAVIYLLHGGRRSAAYALVRSVYEALMRGMWCRTAATDEQLQRLHKDGVMPKLERVVQELAKHEKMPGLVRAKQAGWERMSELAHGGRRQLEQWVSDAGIGPTHADEGVPRLVFSVDFYALMACLSLFAVAGRVDDVASELAPFAESVTMRHAEIKARDASDATSSAAGAAADAGRLSGHEG